MWVIIFLFIVICILTIIVFSFIFKLIKKGERNVVIKRLIKAELLGYMILFMSLGFGFISNIMHDFSSDGKEFIINQKLNNLWLFDFHMMNKSSSYNQLDQEYVEINKSWVDLEKSNKLVEEQDKTATIIQGIMYMLATILIAAGRAKELIVDDASNSEKKISRK